jgi:hypothetical protein
MVSMARGHNNVKLVSGSSLEATLILMISAALTLKLLNWQFPFSTVETSFS